MRTTLNIDDEALAEVRKYADERRISLGEAASSLISRGAVSLPKFEMKNGWVILKSTPGAPPVTTESIAQAEEEYLEEEYLRAFPARR